MNPADADDAMYCLLADVQYTCGFGYGYETLIIRIIVHDTNDTISYWAWERLPTP